MILFCPVCKIKFERKPSLFKRSRINFCSIKCAMKYRKTYQKCSVCKKQFYNKGNNSKRKYCSRLCGEKGRKTGRIVKCELCSKMIYKQKIHLKHKHHFCSNDCANKWQGRNKLEFICKICGKKFKWSKSRTTQANPLYCNWNCRIKDKEHILKNAINGNLIQQKKKGLNKLELAGRKILQDLEIKFNEQVLMFDKFLVDVLLKNDKIIIQWDGEYWHNKPKRKQLDISQDAYLKKCGYKVVRITDGQIKNNLNEVYANIKRAIQ